MLTNSYIVELTALRHALHRHPEISGQEAWTATQVVAALEPLRPARIFTGLGGQGVAAVWEAAVEGPTVLFRAELDALPIEELSEAPHRSTIPGKGHLCGHDGHMTMVLGLARLVSRHPPPRGRLVLLFQPAEENGAGAAAVLADPRFAEIAPEQGVSPSRALAALILAALSAGPGGALEPGFRLVSICHARMGEPAFGITPGEGELWLTLRTLLDADMNALRDDVMRLATGLAEAHGLRVDFSHNDTFAACTNHPEASQIITQALDDLGMGYNETGLPMRASEDFGRFGACAKSAMFLLGAGSTYPGLHNPDYDFPDALIAQGAAIFDRIRRNLLG